MVVRTQTLLGKDAPYVPGWDCHGLPIEWKVEEQYRKKKLNKDEVPVQRVPRRVPRLCPALGRRPARAAEAARASARDWDHPYLTMAYFAEGDDRLRAVQVRRDRPALSRRQAGDVVAGREDRAGRGRDRI